MSRDNLIFPCNLFGLYGLPFTYAGCIDWGSPYSKPTIKKPAGELCAGVTARNVITALQGNRVFIVSPYHDPRKQNVTRVLGIVHHEVKELYCYFCKNSKSVHIVKAEIDIHEDRFGFPYGLADIICPEPPNSNAKYIYLHDSKVNNLTGLTKFRIQNQEFPPYSANFTVCISTMFGNYSNTLQFIQTIEMYKLLGAQKVTLYLKSCSPQIQTVLKYYTKEGTLEVIPWPIDQYLKPSPRWNYNNDTTEIGYYGQITTLNDCVYRNMYRSKYVLLNDVDEIILPFKHQNWEKMMESLQEEHMDVGIFRFENHIFPQTVATEGNFSDTSSWKEVPGFNILQYIYREPDRKDYFNAKKMIMLPLFTTAEYHSRKT
ncbi:glycosyltransferase family 92 -like [Pelobates cultripes]|uniref:Glycosyltransferase family 92 protein n=1 Tax=Pelobates cultripes TaxID=61616 RepID=A0AAD1T507_PELCU|nr:glycosyltransferase family 92 -like [Pelobates cultripes]